MAEDDSAEKTEEPTQKRLDKAHEEGNIPASQEINTLAMLGGVLALVVLMVPGMMRDIAAAMLPFLAEPHAIPMDAEHLGEVTRQIVVATALVLALPLGMFLALGIVSSLIQHGLIWSPKKVALNLEKISVIGGMKRIFSPTSVLQLVKGVVKLIIVGVVLYFIFKPKIPILELLPSMEVIAMMTILKDLTVTLLLAVVISMAVIAGADLLYTRYRHMTKLRMSKSEVKDEAKSSEGDPHVKARIKKIRADRARVRMMQAVPKASVVVTNPTHYAVALAYEMDDMAAPRLVAKGIDSLALKIREVAEENDVPIVENPPLARALYAAVDLDQEIPPEHYKPVAEVIGYVMRLKGRMRPRPAP